MSEPKPAWRALSFGSAMTRALAVLALLLPLVAHPAPPELGTDDYEALSPYARWIEAQVSHMGVRCCSLADCRIAEWRPKGAGVEVYLTEAKWPHAPNGWVAVPDVVIKRDENPTGRIVACWSAAHVPDGGFYCVFLPAFV